MIQEIRLDELDITLDYYYRTKDKPKYLNKLIDRISILYIEKYGSKSYTKSVDSIVSLLYNIVKSIKYESDGLFISRDRNFYNTDVIVNGSVLQCNVGYTGIINTLDLLELLGMLVVSKGYSYDERSQSGYVLFTPELIDMVESNVDMNKVSRTPRNNVLIVKDINGTPICFRKTKEIRIMIDLLKDYNNFMSKREVYCRDKKLNTDLHRSFSRGSFEFGGRFYSEAYGVQQLTKRLRKEIIIDGEETIELDFKALHPSIIYASKGIELDEDFDVYGGTQAMFDLCYELDTTYINNRNLIERYQPIRNILKLCMLVMLNAKSRHTAIYTIKQEIEKDNALPLEDRRFYGVYGLTVEDCVKYLTKHNTLIKDHFFSDAGIKLQNMDSNIIACVMEECIHKNIPALFVHDSVVCPLSNLGECLLIMKNAFKRVVGNELNCKIEV